MPLSADPLGRPQLVIEEVGERSARVRLASRAHMRPGGTVSGPAMFTLPTSRLRRHHRTLGEAGLDAVTTNMNINFLAKPEPRDMVA